MDNASFERALAAFLLLDTGATMRRLRRAPVIYVSDAAAALYDVIQEAPDHARRDLTGYVSQQLQVAANAVHYARESRWEHAIRCAHQTRPEDVLALAEAVATLSIEGLAQIGTLDFVVGMLARADATARTA